MKAYMSLLRSSGDWVIDYYKYPAPLALRSDDADSKELFLQPSDNSPG
jgi:hypothetical protein